MATKKKLPYREVLLPEKSNSWQTGMYDYGYGVVEYDYDTQGDGNDRVITGSITRINCNSLYENITKKSKIENINDYCLDRFIRKSFTKDVVSFVVRSGYYGGEADYKIADSFGEQLNNFIIQLNNNLDGKENTNLIEQVLILEYGYILPELKNKIWSFETIKLNFINPAAGMKHVQKSIVDEYKNQTIDGKYNLTCVCQLNDKLEYRLIDGYHRFAAANQLMLTKMDAIVCM